jgi:pimeloyl-ACP methyl ester carboxylesterase
MDTERVHRAVSDDGTTIAGRVCGQGPPLVLVHGAIADGESEWGALLPYLTERFTCYIPSGRGRGLSDTHPDLSREAHVRDVTAFVDSIGEPVGMVAVSGGGMYALGAAARTPAIRALVAREPVVFEVMTDEYRARYARAVDRMAAAAERGLVTEALEPFVELIANDEEAAAFSEDADGIEAAGRYLQVDIENFREAIAFSGPSPTDAAVLGRIAAPVLLLLGTRTPTLFTDGVRYAAQHIPDATAREIPGTGHFGHLMYPERDAAEVIPFLDAVFQTT